MTIEQPVFKTYLKYRFCVTLVRIVENVYYGKASVRHAAVLFRSVF